MMDREEKVKKLKSLFHLDVDAVHSYGQAIPKIEDENIREQVSKFQDDHQRHIANLSEVFKHLGEEPPEYSRDFKGYFIEGFTAITSLGGTKGALQGLRNAEKMTNSRYEESLKWDIEQEILDTLQQHYDDEKRHLGYIERAISELEVREEERSKKGSETR
jgi:rubrerythrin